MPPRRRKRRTLKDIGPYGISGSAVIPGTEQAFTPVGRGDKLRDVGSGTSVSRQQALGDRLRLSVGTPTQSGPGTRYDQVRLSVGRPTQSGGGSKLGEDPIIVVAPRGNTKGSNKWMENQEIIQVVLAGLQSKGAVDHEGNPQRDVEQKRLTPRERALYNRMKLTGRMPSPTTGIRGRPEGSRY